MQAPSIIGLLTSAMLLQIMARGGSLLQVILSHLIRLAVMYVCMYVCLTSPWYCHLFLQRIIHPTPIDAAV